MADLAEMLRAFDEALTASPLRDMATWVSSGVFPDLAGFRRVGFTADNLARAEEAALARRGFTGRWGFSIPCAEAVDVLRRLSPLVEVGAGSGYWTRAVRSAGGDMLATDPHPEGQAIYRFRPGAYAPLEALGAAEAVRAYPERNVFCSWPSEGEGWMAEAARAMAPGRYLALVGMARGGLTGDAALFDLLDDGFEPAGDMDMPQFPGVPDRLTVHRRKER